MKTSLSQARGIYSSKGTIIIPHQIIARYEYSATTYKGPPFGYSEGTIILTHPLPGEKFEEYILHPETSGQSPQAGVLRPES